MRRNWSRDWQSLGRISRLQVRDIRSADGVARGEEAVEDGDAGALALDVVDAVSGEGEIGVVGAGDESLLAEVPGGEVEVVAGEAHAVLDFSEADLGVEGVGAALVIEDSEDGKAAVELALHLVHEVDGSGERDVAKGSSLS